MLKKSQQSYSAIVFKVFFAAFILLFAVEALIPGFVTNWFNPIWLLIVGLISGIIATMKD